MIRPKSIFTTFFATFFILIFFASCTNKNGKNDSNSSNRDVVNVSNLGYVSFDDSKICGETWRKDNNLIVHTLKDPDDMHPTNGTATANTLDIMLYTQVTLMRFDYENQQYKPYLAKTSPVISADELEFTYTLRNDITWDDGSTVSAEDVLFTLKACKCPLTNNPHAKPMLSNIKDLIIDQTSRNSFKVRMKNKYIQNISLWTDVPILQRSYFDPKNVLAKYTFVQFDDPSFKADANKDLKDWSINFNDDKYGHDIQYIVGAGQYKFEKWEPGQSVTLVRKQNHWSKEKEGLYSNSYPDKIIFKVNKDPNATQLDFKNQVYDVSYFMDPKVLEELQADSNFNKNYNSKFVDTYYYSYAAMNTKPDGIQHKKLFTDKKVRRAMAYLFPLDNINKMLNSSRSKRMISCVSPNSPEFNATLTPIPFDVNSAKKLLEEAGWKDSDRDQILDKVIDGEKIKFEFNLQYMNSSKVWEDIAKQISEAMLKVGVKANLLQLEPSVNREKSEAHDFDMLLSSWSGSATLEDFSQIWGSGSWASKGSNFAGFGNAESDALIQQINQSIVDSIRVPLVKKFQQMVYDEQPYVFMFASMRKVAIHKRFGNQKVYFERPGVLLNNLRLLSCKEQNNSHP